MNIRFRTVRLEKRYPLKISRGTSTGSNNLFVEVEDELGNVGLGECAPGTGYDDTLAPIAQAELTELAAQGLDDPITDIWQRGREQGVNASALAALDTALWDLKAKQSNNPLYLLLGLGLPTVPTSVTIGINPVEVIRERVPEILARTGARALKIKLGNPEGIDLDQASYLAAAEVARPYRVKLRIDANGGWSVPNARKMITWLADHGCDYVEQPLARGEEAGLPELFEGRALPIFADESCHYAADVPALAHCVDGVNLKLMKCGGITEALRIVTTARNHGLKTMIGCMGESSCAIAAGAAIGALFDHIDLDSHLNLMPDPCTGLSLIDGVVTPRAVPGHGATLNHDTA